MAVLVHGEGEDGSAPEAGSAEGREPLSAEHLRVEAADDELWAFVYGLDEFDLRQVALRFAGMLAIDSELHSIGATWDRVVQACPGGTVTTDHCRRLLELKRAASHRRDPS